MKRAIVLTILFLVAVGVTVPLIESEARRGRAQYSRRHGKSYKKHSRSWWRRYHARVRQRRANAARQRALSRWRAQQAPATLQAAGAGNDVVNRPDANPTVVSANSSMRAAAPQMSEERAGYALNSNHAISSVNSNGAQQSSRRQRGRAVAPTGVVNLSNAQADSSHGGVYQDPRGEFSLNLPESWSSRPQMVGGEARFKVFAANGQPNGEASLTVTAARGTDDPNSRARNRTLGGVNLRELRRIVIERMATTGGWVVNDGEKVINGRRVYFVVAQAGGANGAPPQNVTYYFTEADGKILILGTSAEVKDSDRVAADSSSVLTTFRARAQK